jgi:amidophosphoribosyltransferase
VIKGKRLIVVDDSIVRGNTQRALVAMLREAGAAEVHVRISSPPIKWPCFYGIDFASRAELLAAGLAVDEVRQAIGADTLGYLSEDGMIAATDQPRQSLCTACFTGKYPIAIPDAERLDRTLTAAADGCDPGPDAELAGVLFDADSLRAHAMQQIGGPFLGDPGRQE